MSENDWNCIKTYGKVVGTYELLSPNLLVAEPKLIHQVLIENFPNFAHHRKYALIHQPFGMSLFQVDYDSWKSSRKLLSPVFTTASIKKITFLIEAAYNTLMNNLEKFIISGESFDVRPYFESFVLDSILRTFFAAEVDSANDSINPLIVNARKVFMKNITLEQLIALLSNTLAKIFDCRVFDKEATDFMTKLIQSIINDRKKNNDKYNDLLQALLDSRIDNTVSTKIRLSDKEVIDNCILALIGGFDTTSSALINLSYNLVNNPLVYEKLLKEIDDNLDENKVTFEDIDKLVYLEACIFESLRLEPSASRVERYSIINSHLGDIFIPKDTLITIPVKAVHRDPDNFENPNEFIPERFLPENKHNIKAGTFLTFADGPRNCLGRRFALTEIKYCLAKLCMKYRFAKCDETEPIEYYFGQVIAMPKKMTLKVQRRYS